jgi:excisionase family DNA binding protein
VIGAHATFQRLLPLLIGDHKGESVIDEKIDLMLLRLDRIEVALAELKQERTAKELYSTAEAAEILGRSDYTVREWCRKGQTYAVKSPNGRGWLIPHEDLIRLRNEGPLPEQQAHRVLDR